MFESIGKLMLAGLGALSMTRERAEQIFDEYVRRGEAEKADRSGFVKDLMDSADKARTDLEELIAKQVRQGLATLNVATREDIERLEAKVDELLKQTS